MGPPPQLPQRRPSPRLGTRTGRPGLASIWIGEASYREPFTRNALNNNPLLTSDLAVELLTRRVQSTPDDVPTIAHLLLIQLARAGHSDIAFAAIAGPATATGALKNLLADDDLDSLASLARLLLAVANPDNDTAANALVHLALAAHIDGDTDTATQAVHDARRLTPGNEAQWVNELAQIADIHPEVATLSTAFTEPLPAPPGTTDA